MKANIITNHLNEKTRCILMKLSDITVAVYCPNLERPIILQQELENIINCLTQTKCKITTSMDKLEETLLQIGVSLTKSKGH